MRTRCLIHRADLLVPKELAHGRDRAIVAGGEQLKKDAHGSNDVRRFAVAAIARLNPPLQVVEGFPLGAGGGATANFRSGAYSAALLRNQSPSIFIARRRVRKGSNASPCVAAVKA